MNPSLSLQHTYHRHYSITVVHYYLHHLTLRALAETLICGNSSGLRVNKNRGTESVFESYYILHIHIENYFDFNMGIRQNHSQNY